MDDHLILCSICLDNFKSPDKFFEHLKSNSHRKKWLNRVYMRNRKQFVEDKHGLSIEVKENAELQYKREFNTISITPDSEEAFTFDMTLVYKGTEEFYFHGANILNEVSLISSHSDMKLNDQYGVCDRKKVIKLKNGSCYNITCTIKPGNLSRTLHIPIIFEFVGKIDENESIYFGKSLELKGGISTLLDFGDYVPGVPVSGFDENELERTLPLWRYYLPVSLTRAAYDNDADSIRKETKIGPKLSKRNHCQYYRTLLWLEELQLHLDIQYYGKMAVPLYHAHDGGYNEDRLLKYAELEVEGLSENRPSVLIGEKIMARHSKNKDLQRWYAGDTHAILSSSVFLAFEQRKFMEDLRDGMLFDIEFMIGRKVLQCSHRALDICRGALDHLLFPGPPLEPPPPLPDITLYDSNLKNNPEQMQAVRHIVAGSAFPSPYLVFGPPGTGKTVTIVEAIKQTLHLHTRSRVLACAPSNSACDRITTLLLDHLTSVHVYRLYGASRSKFCNKIPQNVKDASNMKESTVHFPNKAFLMTKRVLVCTITTASRLVDAEFPEGFFTHVFLDEVGHSNEPEALIPLGVLNKHGNLVLAGDPQQLGPVVRNEQAIGGRSIIFPHTGLELSYLERLMNMDIYSPTFGDSNSGDGNNNGSIKHSIYNPSLVTKLLKNYRCHKSILHIPNELFYKSELLVEGDPSVTDCFTKWPFLKTMDFPMIFHCTPGQDKMSDKSPSYFNQQEIDVVLSYLKKLFNNKEFPIRHGDIGIISPYRLQVEKIRDAIFESYRHCHTWIKVGSVEDFQGEEKKVIIISTVRASNDLLAKDDVFRLGFLRNPKRFNVAITRAQSLLILVGSANVLQLDSNWKKLMSFITENGGYVGQQPPAPIQNLDTILNAKETDARPKVGQISAKQIIESPAFAHY